jgi:D-alanyl-D-alanine carboxypeptidase (penicillin-binding protein 5/6)
LETTKDHTGFFGRIRACLALAMSLVLAGTLCIPASADVRDTDIVAGQALSEGSVSQESYPDITAEAAYVVNADGTVYYERNSTEEVKIASLTKLACALTALDNASLDTTITVSADAASVGESSAGLLEGDTMDLQTALYALLVPSGNDAAVAIAESIGAQMGGDDPEATFVEAMNEKAAELGCTDTLFTNPHGLDEDEFESDAHSTAQDVAVLIEAALSNETIRGILAGGSTDILVTSAEGTARTVSLTTTDDLLGNYDGLIGGKTGTTNLAGYCFAAGAETDEGTVYTVVLGSPSSSERFSDTTTLFNWTYEHLVEIPLINGLTSDGEDEPLVAEVAQTCWTDARVKATVSDPDLQAEIFDLYGAVTQTVTYDEPSGAVDEGQKLGTITFEQNGKTVASTDLVAMEDSPAPNPFEAIGVAIDRWIRSIQGEPTVATSSCYNTVEE